MQIQKKITEENSDRLIPTGVFTLGSARVDPDAQTITLNGHSERVEARVMKVLLTLVSANCNVVSRYEIEQAVWTDKIVTDDAVTNAVGRLRKILGDSPRNPEFIETISKKGYRLILKPIYEPKNNSAIKFLNPLSKKGVKMLAIAGVLSIVLIATFFLLNGRSVTGSKYKDVFAPPRIAVIPLEMLEKENSDSYFADGITLDLITELSRIPGLLMIAPETSFGYGRTLFDDNAIAKETGAEFLIRGGVQRSKEQLRINIRLIDTQNDRTIWANRFTGKVEQVFQIQDEILVNITNKLRERLGHTLDLPKRQDQPGSIASYDAFLHGLDHFGRRTPDDNEIAQSYFEQAIKMDPDFARAYSGLALTMSRKAIDGWTTSPKNTLEKALELTKRALSINVDIPQVYFAKAQVELFLGNHENALRDVNRAIKLNSNYADAYALLAWIYHYSGRHDKALPALNEAIKRNPHSSASYHEIAGEVYFATEQYQKGIREFSATLNRNPAHMRARLWLAASYMKSGQVCSGQPIPDTLI